MVWELNTNAKYAVMKVIGDGALSTGIFRYQASNSETLIHGALGVYDFISPSHRRAATLTACAASAFLTPNISTTSPGSRTLVTVCASVSYI